MQGGVWVAVKKWVLFEKFRHREVIEDNPIFRASPPLYIRSCARHLQFQPAVRRGWCTNTSGDDHGALGPGKMTIAVVKRETDETLHTLGLKTGNRLWFSLPIVSPPRSEIHPYSYYFVYSYPSSTNLSNWSVPP